MVMPKEEDEQLNSLVYDIKLSSVVPARVTGENKSHELTGMDLAMKLHYLKGLYFFKNYTNTTDHHNNVTDDSDGNNNSNSNSNGTVPSIYELKQPMFDWLVTYVLACGRVRTSPESRGRPVIKLNDAGIRVVEARSGKTVDEWLAMEGFVGSQDQLVYGDALGPDLGFTPLVFLQVTWFKCGGLSVGLSWAHVLGDVFSASTFMNTFGCYLEGHHRLAHSLSDPDPAKPKIPLSRPTTQPCSLKRVNPVGDHWAVATDCKMGTCSFFLTLTQLRQLNSRVHGSLKGEKKGMSGKCFELISAIMWKSIAKVRKASDPKVVTICRPKTIDREQMIPYNGLVLGSTKVNFLVSKVDPIELISLIDQNMIDETNEIEELVNEENGQGDFVVYGANLTFVDMEEANIYGFKLKGQCPTFASYTLNGVGEEGVVLVLPGANADEEGNVGKLVVVVMPQHEVEGLKNELRGEWSIV